jgi:ubiquinone/menaquinone biosynthesis C-methylase UbiE
MPSIRSGIVTDVAERYGENLFAHGHEREAIRLDALSRMHDPVTRERLSSLVRHGMRCVDVGAGLGRVASWLAEQVAPGEVIALDRDTRLLETLPRVYPTVQVRTGDVTDPGLDLGEFDLVHSRMVLMHLRERAEVLGRLASWLKPGGWLVLSDTIKANMLSEPENPLRQLMDAHWPALGETIGTDWTWGLRLPRLMRQAGLTDVGVEIYYPPITSTSPARRFWELNFERLRGRVLDLGLVDEETFDAAMVTLGDPGFADVSMGLVTAWGRRP